MCVCVCVCECVRACMCMCLPLRLCVWVGVRSNEMVLQYIYMCRYEACIRIKYRLTSLDLINMFISTRSFLRVNIFT